MHISFRTPAVALLLTLPGLFLPSLAHAHAHLRQAEPPVGGTVRSAPAQVDLTFSEAVEPRFSTVAVTDAAVLAAARIRVNTATVPLLLLIVC